MPPEFPLPPREREREKQLVEKQLDLIVRTVNVHDTSERDEWSNDDWIVPRLAGIAKRLHLNHGDQVGLIGITESTRRIGACLYQEPGHCTATEGLASALRHFFGETVTHYHNDKGGSSAKDIGIVMGREWQRLDTQSCKMGIQWSGNIPWWAWLIGPSVVATVIGVYLIGGLIESQIASWF